jgi:hypothetical protein
MMLFSFSTGSLRGSACDTYKEVKAENRMSFLFCGLFGSIESKRTLQLTLFCDLFGSIESKRTLQLTTGDAASGFPAWLVTWCR